MMVFPGAMSSSFIISPKIAPRIKKAAIEYRYKKPNSLMIGGKYPAK
jgi:hypothetical protein